MQIVGLTGNIGSGKSTVGRAFQALGIPVFDSDDEAKKAYEITSIQNAVIAILGEDIKFSSQSWKTQIAEQIFSDSIKRQHLEKLIHGHVQHSFQIWRSNQLASYVIRESALANSFNTDNCDWLIEVQADTELRLKRVLQRGGISEQDFIKRNSIQSRNEKFPGNKTLVIRNNEEEMILRTILDYDKKIQQS